MVGFLGDFWHTFYTSGRSRYIPIAKVVSNYVMSHDVTPKSYFIFPGKPAILVNYDQIQTDDIVLAFSSNYWSPQ